MNRIKNENVRFCVLNVFKVTWMNVSHVGMVIYNALQLTGWSGTNILVQLDE